MLLVSNGPILGTCHYSPTCPDEIRKSPTLRYQDPLPLIDVPQFRSPMAAIMFGIVKIIHGKKECAMTYTMRRQSGNGTLEEGRRSAV
jgi:hypothetical protein